MSLADDADLAAEAGQRVAAAAQTAQQVFNNWVLYEQRKEKQDERGQRQETGSQRADDRAGKAAKAAAANQRRTEERRIDRELIAPAGEPEDYRLADVLGPVVHTGLRLVTNDPDFEDVPDPARVVQKMQTLDPDGSLAAANAAAAAGELLSKQDGNVATLLPLGARTTVAGSQSRVAAGLSPAVPADEAIQTGADRAEQIHGQDVVLEYLVGNRLVAQEDYLIGNQLVTSEDYLRATNPLAAGSEDDASPYPDSRLTR